MARKIATAEVTETAVKTTVTLTLASGGTLELKTGRYVKVGARRNGTACLIVDATAGLVYTNRRGEVKFLTDKEAESILRSGINTRVSESTELPEIKAGADKGDLTIGDLISA